MRLSLSYTALLALELLEMKILFHYHCSFLQLFHTCNNVIGHSSGSLQWPALPTSITISKSCRLTGRGVWRARCLVTQGLGVMTGTATATKTLLWLENACLRQEQDNMLSNYPRPQNGIRMEIKLPLGMTRTLRQSWRWCLGHVVNKVE